MVDDDSLEGGDCTSRYLCKLSWVLCSGGYNMVVEKISIMSLCVLVR